MQDRIIEKAKQLGINTSSGNGLEKLEEIALQLGIENFDPTGDLSVLENALDAELGLQGENIPSESIETSDENISSDATNMQSQREPRFGENEYNAAKGKDGSYDKDYYKKRDKELAQQEADARNRKNNNQKEVTKKGPQGEQINQLRNKNLLDKTKDNAALLKAKNDRFQNKLNGAKAKAYQIMHPGQALKNKAKTAVKNVSKKAAKKVGKAVAAGAKKLGVYLLSNPVILLIVIIIGFVFLLIIFLFFFSFEAEASSGKGLYGYNYVEPTCTEITINGGDYAGVYDIEEYVAGVITAEFGVFVGNERQEAAKAGAIAARSYVLANINETCTVESSQRFQVYKTPTEGAIQLANETRGLVLTRNEEIISTQYDAFCTNIPQDDPDYYIICQQNQKIPRDWVDNEKYILNAWKKGTKEGAHGNGMSQWGAAYLAEQGSTYSELLEYYYEDFELMSIYESFGNYGDYPINPDDQTYGELAFLTDQPFDEFLSDQGTTIEEYNNFLYNKIETAGIGTREGVVTAALSLIGSLSEMGVKLNYQWGGKYYKLGTNANWGDKADMNALCDNYEDQGYTKSVCTTNYGWHGFDCSGFVNWALINGMQDTSVTLQTTDIEGGISLSPSNSVCETGGVLVSRGHIALVVGHDDENNRYIVAESTGSRIAKGTGGVKLSYYSYSKTGYVCKNLNEIYGD